MARQRMARADRERQILSVAEQLFLERGHQHATMDELAERVGVTKPVIYDYFGSKDGVLVALLRRIRDGLNDVTLAAMEGLTEFEDVMYKGFEVFFEYFDDPFRAWCLRNAAGEGTASVEIEELRRERAAFMADFIALHGTDVSPVDARVYAEMMVGACERLALIRLERNEITSQSAATYMVNTFWHGLAASEFSRSNHGST